MEITIVDQPLLEIVKKHHTEVDLLLIERPTAFETYLDPDTFHSIINDELLLVNASENRRHADIKSKAQYEKHIDQTERKVKSVDRLRFENASERIEHFRTATRPKVIYIEHNFSVTARKRRVTSVAMLSSYFNAPPRLRKECNRGHALRSRDWTYRRYRLQLLDIVEFLNVTSTAHEMYVDKTIPYTIVTCAEKYLDEQIKCLNEVFDGMNVEIIIVNDPSYLESIYKYKPRILGGSKALPDKRITLDYILKMGGNPQWIGWTLRSKANAILRAKKPPKTIKYTKEEIESMRLEKYPEVVVNFKANRLRSLIVAKTVTNRELRMNALIDQIEIAIDRCHEIGLSKDDVYRKLCPRTILIFERYIENVYRDK